MTYLVLAVPDNLKARLVDAAEARGVELATIVRQMLDAGLNNLDARKIGARAMNAGKTPEQKLAHGRKAAAARWAGKTDEEKMAQVRKAVAGRLAKRDARRPD